MRMKHSVVLRVEDGHAGILGVYHALPEDALNFKAEPVTEWQGYGPNEHEEFIGIEYSWETE